MNRFHSSGTASGNVEVMWMWKMTMPTTAIVHSVPPRENSSTSGSVNSITVPRCASKDAPREGRGPSGERGHTRRLNALNRFQGVFEIITETTNGKCLLSLEVAAPSQMHTSTSCEATIRFEI